MNVRVAIALFLGMLLCGAFVHAQDTLVVSERVGKVIDAEECRYFGLFPDLTIPKGIVLLGDGLSGAIVESNSHTIGRLNSEQLALLIEYVEEYDSLRMEDRRGAIARDVNNRFELLWSTGIADMFESWEGETIQVTVRSGSADSTTLKGELLWADRRQLFILPEGAGESGVPMRFTPESLKSISTFTREPGRGALIGAGIGAGFGIAYFASVYDELAHYDTGYDLFVVTALAVFAAVPASVIGAIIGLVSYYEHRHQINYLYEYNTVLRELEEIMYYRYGLPPDSPWREQ